MRLCIRKHLMQFRIDLPKQFGKHERCANGNDSLWRFHQIADPAHHGTAGAKQTICQVDQALVVHPLHQLI